MRLAALDKVVELQTPPASLGSNFTTYATVAALVAPQVPRGERDVRGQKVWIEFRNDVGAHHRVLFGTRELDVLDVNNPRERNRELVLYCREWITPHTITIETPVETQDEYGEPVESWILLATVPAEVIPVTGRERFVAQQVDAEVTHRVMLRPVAGVTPKHRVLFDNRALDINAVLNKDERNTEMELLCTERVP